LTSATITPGSAGGRAAAVLDGQLTSNDPDTPSVFCVLRVTASELRRCPFTHDPRTLKVKASPHWFPKHDTLYPEWILCICIRKRDILLPFQATSLSEKANLYPDTGDFVARNGNDVACFRIQSSRFRQQDICFRIQSILFWKPV